VEVNSGMAREEEDGSAERNMVKDENGRKRSKTDIRYGKTKTVGSGYFHI
jgi:hypothetical protein